MSMLKFWKKEKTGTAEKSPSQADRRQKGATREPAKSAAKQEKSGVQAKDSKRAPEILIRPLETEKTAKTGAYAFWVPLDATKSEVKKAVRALYGVTPRKVNVLNLKGKPARVGRTVSNRQDRRKAWVLLKSGESISIK